MWALYPDKHKKNAGAGNETRTRNPQLGRLMLYQLSYSRRAHHTRHSEEMVEGGGFEPPKAMPTDLQSVPFSHSGTPPFTISLSNNFRIKHNPQQVMLFLSQLELAMGFEPATC